MSAARTALRWLAGALGLLTVAGAALFGLLQTPIGKVWLEERIAQAISDPDFTVAIDGLDGLVPFRMTVARIEIGDRDGAYLTAHNVALDISARALLAGRGHIRSLEIAQIDWARLTTAPSTTPWIDYLQVPHLPVGLVVDRVSIGTIALAPPVLGEALAATIQGDARLTRSNAHISLDLHRTDVVDGDIALGMELAGSPPVLSLKVSGAEPTGVLLDRMLSRADRLPLTFSVSGTGALADWHGHLGASAGSLARLDAEVRLAVGTVTAMGVSGSAAVAPLLPAGFAPLAGDRIGFSLRTSFGDRIALDPITVETAAGSVVGEAVFGSQPEEAISAHLRGNLPELGVFESLLGQPVRGSASFSVTVAGTQSRPSLELKITGNDVRFASSGAELIEADLSATPTGALDNPDTRIDVAAKGRIGELIAPEGAPIPSEPKPDIDWSLSGAVARDLHSISVTRLAAEGAGLALAASGQLTEGGAIAGEGSLSVADLRPLSGFVGQNLAGSLFLEANAAREGTAGFALQLAGSAKGLTTGLPAADAVLGGEPVIAASLHRDDTGLLTLDRFTISGKAANASGNARFDAASHELTAAIELDMPQLNPLRTVLGADLAGAVSAHFDLNGPLERLALQGKLEGRDIAAAGATLDRLLLAAQIPDLSDPKAELDGSFRGYGLDGRVALAAETQGSELVLPRLKITAADSAIGGSLRVALDTGLLRGSISGRVPDLGPWSELASTPLGGSIEFAAGLDARGGQLIDLSASGTKLMAGTGSSRMVAGGLTVKARFADIWRAPSGTGRLSLSSASVGAAEFKAVNLTLDAPKAGRFAFQGDAEGQPLTMALAGDGEFAPGRIDLRVSRFAGSLGKDRVRLEQPLTFSKRGSDLALAGLALDLGTGRITGNGSVRGEALSLTMNANDLPIALAARLVGYPNARGRAALATTIGGTLRAPQGHFSVTAREFALASLKHSQLPTLGLTGEGNWNGRNLDLHGQVTGLKGDQIGFTGSVPMVLRTAPLGISVPPDGGISLGLQAAGQLEHLADLLPLGEDRVSGRFAADLAVGGTVASPAASGWLQLSDARYENFTSGAVLTGIEANLVGDRDHFTLTSFSAGDKASGTLKAQGYLALKGPSGPTAELSASLANFRLAARDEVVATASGKVSITGPLAAPSVTAPLKIDRADITLPDTLPPNVVVLKVVEKNGKAAMQQPSAAVEQAPALPATLDLTLDMPGNIFVRGHGLESEWRGRLKITGTSSAPAITGALEQIRGTVDLLGKTFTLTRGAITFDGTAKLDPVLDIVAEASAADITAQVRIGGFASAPTVTLSSTPSLPRDEILARVLFNGGVGQLTAGQGLQLAAAAGTLAGGGPGVLDRLRGGLGLDWFRLGSGPTGPGTSILNPRTVNSGTASGTALSAGKYLVPGVSVGVTQGVSPPTSKITVEIELRPHLTVQGEAGQSGSTGIGLNYNYDY